MSDATRTTSDIMVELIRLIERKRDARLTADEARDAKLKADILMCAKVLRKYVQKKGTK